MRVVFVLFICSILILASGCVTNDRFEDRIATIESKMDDLSSRCIERRTIIDVNNDGMISRTEFDSRLREVFTLERKVLDANGDGKISRQEFIVAKRSTKFFSIYDNDQNGLISETEFILSFDNRFDIADRNNDGVISMKDAGLEDTNNNGEIEILEYREAADQFFAELVSQSTVRGYGYGPCSSRYVLCDASCTRCIALFIRAPLGGSWGGTWPESGPDPCEGVNCGDPWGEDYDPLNPCC
jgi:Ca2+-binding EF-hand superfamily protein